MKGCASKPQLSAPTFSAARIVVAEPANGSNTLTSPCLEASLITDSTHSAEKPALYRNHRWTGNPIFGTNVEVGVAKTWASVGNKTVCICRDAIKIETPIEVYIARDQSHKKLSRLHANFFVVLYV